MRTTFNRERTLGRLRVGLTYKKPPKQHSKRVHVGGCAPDGERSPPRLQFFAATRSARLPEAAATLPPISPSTWGLRTAAAAAAAAAPASAMGLPALRVQARPSSLVEAPPPVLTQRPADAATSSRSASRTRSFAHRSVPSRNHRRHRRHSHCGTPANASGNKAASVGEEVKEDGLVVQLDAPAPVLYGVSANKQTSRG